MFRDLETARDALAQCATITTAQAAVPATGSCAIGLEANISPADYPMIRIVPVRIIPGKGYGARACEALLYFGVPIANSEGLEAVYEELFDFEAEIIDVLGALRGRYIETVTDEDRLDTYKLMAIRCEISDLSHVRLAGVANLAVSYAIGS